MKEITTEELKKFNGKNGNPVYIAHGEAVFDVTESKLWKEGLHMRRHNSGADLTAEITAAPHGTEVLGRYPQVAVLRKKETAPRPLPELLTRLLRRFPLLRRHPHPMTVHFPIAFMFSAPLFTLLYLATGIESFEGTARNCLGAGLIFTPLAMATGYYTWWLNYEARPLRPVTIKQRLSLVLLALGAIVFSWRLTTPDILTAFGPASALYLFFLCALLPLVMAIGWFGGTLTFPVGKE